MWKEAQKLIGTKTVQELHDPLDVIETIMRYFYSLAETLKANGGTLAEIIGYYEKAARLAALAAPYRHGRLSAIKLIGDPNAVSTFKPNATAEELRVELARRVAAMRDAGLIDLEALPPPERKVAN